MVMMQVAFYLFLTKLKPIYDNCDLKNLSCLYQPNFQYNLPKNIQVLILSYTTFFRIKLSNWLFSEQNYLSVMFHH